MSWGHLIRAGYSRLGKSHSTCFVLQKKQSEDSIEGVFLGATDRVKEGTFIWEETQQPVTYTNWRGNQPDNNYYKFKGENCLHMALPSWYPGTWNDISCYEREYQNTMCERILPLGKQFTWKPDGLEN